MKKNLHDQSLSPELFNLIQDDQIRFLHIIHEEISNKKPFEIRILMI